LLLFSTRLVGITQKELQSNGVPNVKTLQGRIEIMRVSKKLNSTPRLSREEEEELNKKLTP
jgi:hypothetical protein